MKELNHYYIMSPVNTNKPLISIIVPIYNCAKYLAQCIESILTQTYTNLQIILVDDGSSDNSGKICDEYATKDKRIIVIHQTNGGVSAARNAGLKAATGEYIGFVDGDDYIARNMYDYLYQLVSKYNTKISVCNYYEVRESEIKICADSPTQEQKLSTKDALLLLLRVLSVWHQLFHKDIFQHIRFDTNISYAEDLYVSFQAFQQAKIISYGPKPLYYYRQHSASVTCNSKWNPKHLGYIIATETILVYARQNNLQQLYIKFRTSQFNILASFLRDCLINGPFDEKSFQELQIYFKRHLKEFLSSKIKISKKAFVLCAFINLNLAKRLYCLTNKR